MTSPANSHVNGLSPNGDGTIDADGHSTCTSTSQAGLIPEPVLAGEEADVTELLRHLDTADGLANGVESRLDDLLGNLDSLLAVLDNSHNTTTSHSAESETLARGTTREGKPMTMTTATPDSLAINSNSYK